jgi:hypothetical protein
MATDVRLLHDDEALYVGARMYHPNPGSIRTTLTRRDGSSDAERFVISVDTYLDRRTAYTFGVSAAGVRFDVYHPQDQESGESQFDPVWTARVRIDSAGWTAEMRIPFSQLRFSAAEEHVWGLQMARFVPERDEEISWVLIPRAAAGYASNFGRLTGIEGIRPSRRIELMPYSAGDLTFRANVDNRNPFNQKAGGRVGADLKMGLGPNVTLDATINPDFGQVEADPAEVNLTAFETVFDERRPFFIEGNELLTGRAQSFLGRPSYYYSRRVGAAPRGGASGDFVKRPSSTTIVSAAKVTGRLGSGVTLGALAAVTPREHARTHNMASGLSVTVPVEPASSFGVLRLTKEVDRQQSALGLIMTGTRRFFHDGDQMASLAGRSAASAGVDWKFRFMQGMYEFTGFAGASRVAGDTLAMQRVQRSPAHYFQRPDQGHVAYDPTRTSLTGYTFSLRGDKNAGRWSVWGIGVQWRTPGFEINDLGQMRTADDKDFNADYQLRDTKPGKLFRYWQIGHSTRHSFSYGNVRNASSLTQSITLNFHNFWSFNYSTARTFRATSDELTRGGPLMGTPAAWQFQARLTSRPGGRIGWNVRGIYFNDEFDGWRYELFGGLQFRLAPRWQATVDVTYLRAVDPRQYVATRAGGLTYGNRYIFSFIDRAQISMPLRLNYAFSPGLTVEIYAQPFASSGHFHGFGELPVRAPGAPVPRDLRRYGTDGTTIVRQADGTSVITDGADSFSISNQDFNRLSLRSNVVVRWEWAAGSTMYLIWQQNRQEATQSGELIRPGSLGDALTAPGDNFFAIKVSYWIGVK